jgi:hypothetical protein
MGTGVEEGLGGEGLECLGFRMFSLRLFFNV